VAEACPMVENLKGRVRSFFRAQYCLVTAAIATGIIKARSLLLRRDLAAVRLDFAGAAASNGFRVQLRRIPPNRQPQVRG
jgi:hypothetical protein